jgi:hypothetical protein
MTYVLVVCGRQHSIQICAGLGGGWCSRPTNLLFTFINTFSTSLAGNLLRQLLIKTKKIMLNSAALVGVVVLAMVAMALAEKGGNIRPKSELMFNL